MLSKLTDHIMRFVSKLGNYGQRHRLRVTFGSTPSLPLIFYFFKSDLTICYVENLRGKMKDTDLEPFLFSVALVLCIRE